MIAITLGCAAVAAAATLVEGYQPARDHVSPPPAGGQIIRFNDEQSLIFAEAENFTANAGSAWEPREWAKSPHYFASTVADVFHSRRAYLHGPENATNSTDGAASSVTVPAAGEYTVLVRYEMPYRFEVPFSLTITQGSAKKFTRVYGRRTNLKVWPFAAGRARGSLCGPGLQTECAWPWGATENMVWEGAGVGATATLAKGPAVISLSPVKDSDYCCFGDRNIDVVVLHPNSTDVDRRINGTADPADGQVLPLDGLFSQAGEVFFKVQNLNQTHNLSVAVPITYDHAPYMGQHDYLNKTPAYITVPPETTGWVEVGGLMDTFNHGSWKVTCSALNPPPPPPGNETQCIEETRKACPMGAPPWNRTLCAECVAKQKCPGSCTIPIPKNKTYGCSAQWRTLACTPPPPPPPPQEIECWSDIAKICAQNNTKYAANQTECLRCAEQHAGCTMQLLKPGAKKKTLVCPTSPNYPPASSWKCPKACGVPHPILLNNSDPENKTKIHHNETVCESLWFTSACKAMLPPAPPKPPPKPKPYKPSIAGDAHCIITVGVRDKPFDPTDQTVKPLDGRATFDSVLTGTEMLFDASTRASRRMRHNEDDFLEIYEQLFTTQGDVPGKPPATVPIYASTFKLVNGSEISPSGGGPGREDYPTKFHKYIGAFCKEGNSCLMYDESATLDQTSAYIDIRQTNITRLLEAHPDAKQNVATVSLGDEISIRGTGNTSDFQAWCRTQAPPLTPKDLGCSGWADCPLSSSFLNVTKTPALYYYSMKFLHSSGIAAMKTKVQAMQKQLTKALFGANFSPTAYFVDPFDGKQKCQNYIGWTFQWVRVFREQGLTLPWGEDWIWQTPVGTQQMMTLSIDAMRSGIYWAGAPSSVTTAQKSSTWDEKNSSYTRLIPPQKHVEMIFYVMKHYPGNTNNSWTRQFYGDLSHGITRFDLFNFDPSTSGYTCDYVDSDGGAYPTVRAATNQLGSFEDIIHVGMAQPIGAAVGILYSETADIYYDSAGTHGAELRGLYIALKHAGLPVEIFIEEDCTDQVGRLHYTDVLYVTMPHISTSATKGIASWVQAGGTIFATAGAGMLTEANASNTAMSTLLGVSQKALYTGSQDEFNNTVRLIKQDINFVETLDNVTLSSELLTTLYKGGGAAASRTEIGEDKAAALAGTSLVAKGAKSIFSTSTSHVMAQQGASPTTLATFSDGKPAMVHSVVGKGSAYYAGFLPGLAYFAPAIPLRPVDRASVDEGMNHFIPTEFAESAKSLITLPLAARLNESTVRPVIGSHPLVEVGWVYAKGVGSVLPCVNWAAEPLSGFTVQLNHPLLTQGLKTATLASGRNATLDKAAGTVTFDLPLTAEVLVLR